MYFKRFIGIACATAILSGCGVSPVDPDRALRVGVWVENIPCGSIASPEMRVVFSVDQFNEQGQFIGQEILYDVTQAASSISNPSDNLVDAAMLRSCAFLQEVELSPNPFADFDPEGQFLPVRVRVEIPSANFMQFVVGMFEPAPFLTAVFPFRDGEPFITD